MKFGAVTPILRMFDVAKAREFYLDFLDFEVDFEHRFEPDLPLYMEITRGDCRLSLSEHHGDVSPGAHIRIRMEGIEEFQRQLLGKALWLRAAGPRGDAMGARGSSRRSLRESGGILRAEQRRKPGKWASCASPTT